MPYTEIILKWFITLNVKTTTVNLNLLDENLGADICDLELGNDFWDLTPKELTKQKNR